MLSNPTNLCLLPTLASLPAISSVKFPLLNYKTSVMEWKKSTETAQNKADVHLTPVDERLLFFSCLQGGYRVPVLYRETYLPLPAENYGWRSAERSADVMSSVSQQKRAAHKETKERKIFAVYLEVNSLFPLN